MKKLFLLFSHTLTDNQIEEAKSKLSVNKIVYLPENLQKIWSMVSPENELNIKRLQSITEWLKENAGKGDYILIQGEYGSTYYLVNFSFHYGLIPIYSTSKRIYSESVNGDGSVKREHIFKHVNFRRYKEYEK